MEDNKYLLEVVMPEVLKSGVNETSMVAIKCDNWDYLNSVWRYFRSTNPECIQSFGMPDWEIPVVEQDENFEKVVNIYTKFLRCNTPGRATMPLFVRATFPNGNEFYLRRLRAEERQQFNNTYFLCHFMAFSKMPQQYTINVYNSAHALINCPEDSVILRICSTPNVFVAKDFGDAIEYFKSI